MVNEHPTHCALGPLLSYFLIALMTEHTLLIFLLGACGIVLQMVMVRSYSQTFLVCIYLLNNKILASCVNVP